MNRWQINLAAAGLLGLVPAFAGAQEVMVVANPSVKTDSISARELKSVFLGDVTSLSDGTHVQPVLAKGGPAHKAFLRRYLDKDDSALGTYYRALVLTGRGAMPKSVASDADMIAYVAKTRGAIGYVSADTAAEGVRVLYVPGAEHAEHSARKLLARVEPDYPEELKKRAIGGVVRLQVTIASNGSVGHVVLLGGNPILAESAMAAVGQWKYAPGAMTTTELSISFDPQRQ